MTKVMAAHQPNFMPYLGFFDKMISIIDEDVIEKYFVSMGLPAPNDIDEGVFIIRDDAQYVPQEWHSRNRIRIFNGSKYLNVPVEKKMVPIAEIKIIPDGRINNKTPWKKYHLREIQANYKKSHFFDDYFPDLEKIYSKEYELLIDLNMSIINWLADCFDIEVDLVYFSDLPESATGDTPSETLALATQAVDADVYLSGIGGNGYLDLKPFEERDIPVVYQKYEHPIYIQRYPDFVPNMASIDALFNVGCFPVSNKEIKCFS
ncbi:hypothetical protein GQ472_07095 [archaeon]|nr:hypothetical protein [archaeon]